MASAFYYTGLEQLKQDKSERSYYCGFRIFWRETGEELAEIITNASLCGRWVETEYNGPKQVAGTGQYSLPRSEAGVRKALRAMALERIGAELDTLLLRYVDVSPVTIDENGDYIDNPEFVKAEKAAMMNPSYIKRKAELEAILEAL